MGVVLFGAIAVLRPVLSDRIAAVISSNVWLANALTGGRLSVTMATLSTTSMLMWSIRFFL